MSALLERRFMNKSKQFLASAFAASVLALSLSSVSAQTGPLPAPVPTLQPNNPNVATQPNRSVEQARDLSRASMTAGCRKVTSRGINSNPDDKTEITVAVIVCDSRKEFDQFVASAPLASVNSTSHGGKVKGVARPVYAPNYVVYAPAPSYKCLVGQGIWTGYQAVTGS
jgi:hypothetical protein